MEEVVWPKQAARFGGDGGVGGPKTKAPTPSKQSVMGRRSVTLGQGLVRHWPRHRDDGGNAGDPAVAKRGIRPFATGVAQRVR